VGGYWKWKGSEMWIMVEPIAEIPFGIRRSLTRCYGCNSDKGNGDNNKGGQPPLLFFFVCFFFFFFFCFTKIYSIEIYYDINKDDNNKDKDKDNNTDDNRETTTMIQQR
jgi:hypothetical protein